MTTQTQRRSPEEIAAELQALSPSDWARLHMVARRFSYAMEAEDLLQEAITRALEPNRRTCAIGVPIIAFLINVMHGLASDALKKGNGLDATIQVDDIATTDDRASPEESAFWKQHGKAVQAKLNETFKDDHIALDLLEARASGMNASEIKELLELNETEYDSKLKSIKRKLTSAFPQGWR